jgi:hypothetical protein
MATQQFWKIEGSLKRCESDRPQAIVGALGCEDNQQNGTRYFKALFLPAPLDLAHGLVSPDISDPNLTAAQFLSQIKRDWEEHYGENSKIELRLISLVPSISRKEED